MYFFSPYKFTLSSRFSPLSFFLHLPNSTCPFKTHLRRHHPQEASLTYTTLFAPHVHSGTHPHYLNHCFTSLFSWLDHELLKSPDPILFSFYNLQGKDTHQWPIMLVKEGKGRKKMNCFLFLPSFLLLHPHFTSSYYFSQLIIHLLYPSLP